MPTRGPEARGRHHVCHGNVPGSFDIRRITWTFKCHRIQQRRNTKVDAVAGAKEYNWHHRVQRRVESLFEGCESSMDDGQARTSRLEQQLSPAELVGAILESQRGGYKQLDDKGQGRHILPNIL